MPRDYLEDLDTDDAREMLREEAEAEAALTPEEREEFAAWEARLGAAMDKAQASTLAGVAQEDPGLIEEPVLLDTQEGCLALFFPRR